MDALLKRRSHLKARLTRAKNKVDGHAAQPLDSIDIEILEDQMKELWSDINDLDEEIMVTCEDGEGEAHAEAFNEIIERYHQIMHAMRTIAKSINAGGGADINSRQGSRVTATAGPSVKLPKLDLPTFSGNLLEWTQFNDMFKSSVHTQPLSGSQKLQYLKSALRGDAAHLIGSYQITDANYDEAWNVLTKRYQNTREIVRSQIAAFNKQGYLKEKSSSGLRSLVDTSTSCILSLKALGRTVSVDDNNDWVIYGIMERLDPETRELWEAKLGQNVMPKLNELIEFLDERVSILGSSCNHNDKADKSGGKKQVSSHQTTADNKCSYCNSSGHMFYNCEDFLKLSVDDRRNKVRDKNLCFNCLKTGHTANKCTSKGKCKKCKKGHSTLLHIDATNVDQVHLSDAVSAHMTNNDGLLKRALMATALVTVLDSSGVEHQFRALLDAGADVSFVTEKVVQQLKLKKIRAEVGISGLGSNSVGSASALVNIVLRSSFDRDFQLSTEAFVVPKVTGILPKVPLAEVETRLFQGITLADPTFAKPGRIDLLLGAEVFFEVIRDGRISTKPNLPTGQQTVWGYIIGGKCPSQSIATTIAVHHVETELEVNVLLRKFWELEEVPRKQFYTVEEQACENHFATTHSRTSEGRYQVRLPFRENVPELGDSLSLATKRLKNMERQLAKNPERKQQYVDFMNEYIRLGHMEEIPDDEVTKAVGSTYYLPHHPVIKDASTSTKLRVVFDASAKSTSKLSLNDKLMTGPKLQDDLFEILIRFRMHRITIKSDICKMFRQIDVAREDWDFQRILWRDSPELPVQHYRLTTVTYGTSVAPYLAKRCLKQLTIDEDVNFSNACKIAQNDFYMDDLMTGECSIEDAMTLQQQLDALMKKGSFELRKWASNCPELLQTIPTELREVQVPFKIDDTDSIKTLGLNWNPSSDEFRFNVQVSKFDKITKRSILSVNSKIFDPLGWLAPVTVVGKNIFQELWRHEVSWDDEVPEVISHRWISYHQGMKQLEVVKILRCVLPKPDDRFQLFGFSDASEKSYAAVVYLRTSVDGTSNIALLAAKTKVAPIKQVSLPRLELLGAVLLVDLIEAVTTTMRQKPESIIAWTDSTIVLEWLRSHPGRWKTFVANRVSHIQEVLPAKFWHHVSGVDNPADCASRGITANELVQHHLWWHGPDWLLNFDANMEEAQYDFNNSEELHEMKVVSVLHNSTEIDLTLIHKLSSLPRLLKVTAICLRFIYNCRRRQGERRSGPISVSEIQYALQFWIKIVQRIEFGEEFQQLSNSSHIKSRSKILSLNPFLDQAQLIRVGGRLKNAHVNVDRKFPILLPKKHRLTEIIIQYEHKINLHADAQLLLATLQRKFWILGARDIIRFHIRKCIICSRHRAECITQMMGDLPGHRVNPCRPFLRVGVDYAGPLTLRVLKGRGHRTYKGYIAIFVCFVTRAIHLELVSGLTSTAFIAAFKRFTGRRVRCQDLYSDCGRTFVGAQKQLRFVTDKSYTDAVNEILAAENVQFHHNPPGAPHFGGLWEAGIKSVKYHLRRVLGNHTFNYEEMETLLVQIEACLNSRPISPLSSDPCDLQPLTPGHFLIGDALTSVPERSFSTEKLTSLSRWQAVEKIVHDFWKRWSQEYLTRLQQRPKWWSVKNNIEVGDLVLIKDERYPPLKWKMGRVAAIHSGSDNLVRVVTLLTVDGEIKRPVSKLALLPVDQPKS